MGKVPAGEHNIIEYVNCDASDLGRKHLTDEDNIKKLSMQLKIRQ